MRLKGVHVVRKRLRSGVVEYHYAWRGGPRLVGAPGSPEYIASHREACASRKAPRTGRFADLIAAFKASAEYQRLGRHTKRAYARHLDQIHSEFGTLPIKALDDARVRRHFLRWRDSMASTPRTADYAIGTLKRLLGWAVERVYISTNQAEPIGRLHSADRSDSIWTADDLAAFKAAASQELWWAVSLAALTGLRQSDLIRLTWTNDDGEAFVVRTSKRGRQALIPITPECRSLLGRIERRHVVILTTHRGGRPWTADGLRSSFAKACRAAGVSRTFHDLRRTAATNLLAAGVDASQVAMVMGWEEAAVDALKRKYVSRSAVVRAVLARLEKGG